MIDRQALMFGNSNQRKSMNKMTIQDRQLTTIEIKVSWFGYQDSTCVHLHEANTGYNLANHLFVFFKLQQFHFEKKRKKLDQHALSFIKNFRFKIKQS